MKNGDDYYLKNAFNNSDLIEHSAILNSVLYSIFY